MAQNDFSRCLKSRFAETFVCVSLKARRALRAFFMRRDFENFDEEVKFVGSKKDAVWYGICWPDYDAMKEMNPDNSFASVKDYVTTETRSGLHPVVTSYSEIARITHYTRQAVKKALDKMEKFGKISVSSSEKGNRIEIVLHRTSYPPEIRNFLDGHSMKYEMKKAEREKKKEKFENSTAEFGSPDEVNAVMANDFSQLQKQAQPTAPKPQKNPAYQFDNPDELFEVFAREEWSATDALTVLRENSCLCKLPDERREEFVEVNSRERLAPYYHGKSKPTPEQEASAREAAEILYQTIQTEQQCRIDDESKNF